MPSVDRVLRGRQRRLWKLLLAGSVGLAASCADPPPRGPSLTLASQPHAADRYARLLQRELVDSDPPAVHQLITCEEVRIYEAFGRNESQLRMQGVVDSVYRSPGARARFNAIQDTLASRSYEGSPLCDSLNVRVNREFPIVPLDSALKSEYGPG